MISKDIQNVIYLEDYIRLGSGEIDNFGVQLLTNSGVYVRKVGL